MNSPKKTWFAFPYILWIIGFTLIPLGLVLYYAFTGADGGFTLANVLAITEPVHLKSLWTSLKQVLVNAIRPFIDSRIQEGNHLSKDILEKLDGMYRKVELVEKRSPEILKEYREKLENKTKELLADAQIEESRIAAEVILFADKICTDEETVRLKSHINHMKKVLTEEEGAGRKMDFIAQEMNREANTILSKANDLETSNLAIDLKTEIEKVREQIQNIE